MTRVPANSVSLLRASAGRGVSGSGVAARNFMSVAEDAGGDTMSETPLGRLNISGFPSTGWNGHEVTRATWLACADNVVEH